MPRLSTDRFLPIETLVERVVCALDRNEPWSIIRWADSKNWIFSEARHMEQLAPQTPLAYREGRLLAGNHGALKAATIKGLKQADLLGMFAYDEWTETVLAYLGILDELTQPLVYPWCHLYVHAYREWNDEVMGRDCDVALVGNRMADYVPRLTKWFPKLRVVQCDAAGDWPSVANAMARFQETKPRMVLIAAGWFTGAIAYAAKRAGAVALDIGHTPDHHLADPPYWLPNTCCPRGPEGGREHIEKHGNCPHQVGPTHRIKFPWREKEVSR